MKEVINLIPKAAALLLLMGLLSFSASAQYTQEDAMKADSMQRAQSGRQPNNQAERLEHWTKKLRPGGGLSANFGSVTYVNVSPTLGYAVTDKFMPGIGATYIYSSITYTNGYKASSNYVGGNVFARYIVYQNVFLMTEYEVLKVNFEASDGSHASRTIFNPLIGGGLRIPLGERSGILVSALYNLNYNANKYYSPYPNAWVLGFNFVL
ncbi:MAG: hypothetical protein V4543_16055 [Bacteroidota bacterium]